VRPLYTRILYAVLLLTLLARFFYPGTLYLSFFTDDFFYYLAVARNMFLHNSSSFNLIQQTNGYHPLWLLTLTALYAIFRGSTAFFIALTVLIWLLIVGTHRTLAGIPCRSAQERPAVLTACSLFTLLFLAVVSRTGMEISLALFFLAHFYRRVAAQPLEDQTPSQAGITGLIAAAAILSRLDIALIIGVYLLLTPKSLSRFATFTCGLAPVFIYLASNELWFHTLLPISGVAKNLKPLLPPSASTLLSLLQPEFIHILFVWPALMILAAFAWRTRLRTSRVALCVFLHPILFYVTLSFTSDWPLWTWYLYPLVPVAAILGPELTTHWMPHVSLLGRRLPRPELKSGSSQHSANSSQLIVLAVSILVTLSFARLNPVEVLIYHRALALHDFARTHPGIYAMGDAAGTPAYLMNQPVLQLEGLMADPSYLDRIRRREPLAEALTQLHVDYYVTNAAQASGPCYEVREPYKAGPASPKLAARLCTPPIFRLAAPASDLLIFPTH
jgi:hypothetical protein